MANDRNAGRKHNLTKEQEQELYNKFINGTLIAQLSIDYLVSVSTVNRIIRRYKTNNEF